jgi:acyl dehydratase
VRASSVPAARGRVSAAGRACAAPHLPIGNIFGQDGRHNRPTLLELTPMQFGRYFEEFEIGAVYKHWPGKTVTEYDDHLFCLLTMNHHPLHLDAHYAESTEFKKNVVVGNYIYSLLLGMSVPDVSGKAIANEVESLRHIAPTFHGDTVYGETTVLDKTESRSKPDRGVVYVETRGLNQDGTVVCVFRRKVMVPKKPADAAE